MTEKLYTLKRGKHGKYIEDEYKIFKAGQQVPLTESEFKSFRNKFEPAVYMPAQKQAETDNTDQDGDVELPEDWEELTAAEKKKLASKIEGEKIKTVGEADEILKAYEENGDS